ncbi:MAG: hypothetical protein LUG99_01545 [Lachnospiraceae bacterium]|nr:hypothetical protein [Lachnospiraceae bacterium]
MDYKKHKMELTGFEDDGAFVRTGVSGLELCIRNMRWKFIQYEDNNAFVRVAMSYGGSGYSEWGIEPDRSDS